MEREKKQVKGQKVEKARKRVRHATTKNKNKRRTDIIIIFNVIYHTLSISNLQYIHTNIHSHFFTLNIYMNTLIKNEFN